MTFEALLAEYEARRAKALAMGGPEKLAKRKQAGQLNARERIACLVDADSFIEWPFIVRLSPAHLLSGGPAGHSRRVWLPLLSLLPGCTKYTREHAAASWCTSYPLPANLEGYFLGWKKEFDSCRLPRRGRPPP